MNNCKTCLNIFSSFVLFILKLQYYYPAAIYCRIITKCWQILCAYYIYWPAACLMGNSNLLPDFLCRFCGIEKEGRRRRYRNWKSLCKSLERICIYKVMWTFAAQMYNIRDTFTNSTHETSSIYSVWILYFWQML